jgi:hypothetical protein
MPARPTSADLAEFLAPRVKAALRAEEPFLSRLVPFLGLILRVALQILPLVLPLFLSRRGDTSPGAYGPLPWGDEPDDIPPSVRRAALDGVGPEE